VRVESASAERPVRVEIERREDDRIVFKCLRTPCEGTLPTGRYVLRVLPDYDVADREFHVQIRPQGARYVVRPGYPVVGGVGLFVGILGTVVFAGGMAVLLRPRMCDGPGDDCASTDRTAGRAALAGLTVGLIGWIAYGLNRTSFDDLSPRTAQAGPQRALFTF
jgi:hypothetical protein